MSVLAFHDVAWGPAGRAQPVIDGLDLELDPGEVTVLTSGLGGGKSSALRLAVGLEQPWRGTVRVCGQPPGTVRDRIGYVADEGALLANLSLYDNLVLPLRWLRDPPEAEVERRARAVLDLFAVDWPLPPVAPAYAPTNLRRLVALARGLILEPALLLLDDPADDFDEESAGELWRHLVDIARERSIAVLAATSTPPARLDLRVHALGAAAAPATRRFTPGQRRSELVPALGRSPP